jgi:E3 ubiquitin-protein ligase HUWE1
LLAEICSIKSWNIGKCELYHWADVLDKCDAILEASAAKTSDISSWQLACDLPENSRLKLLLQSVLQFTALLIEHSYSRHLYNSIEHLTTLLESTDFHIILSVLNLLYVFSKRSIFINRLTVDKKNALLQRLLYLAESWGGKENGLDLVKCCYYTDLSQFPASSTSVNFEYTIDTSLVQSNQITSHSNIDHEQSSSLNKSTNSSNPQTTTLNSTKSIITKHVRLEKVHLVS